MTKPTSSIVLCTKEIKQTPLKIDFSFKLKGNLLILSADRQAFKSFIMSTIKNHVQLIGNVGQEPTITNLESGKKVARLSLATNENYKNSNGEKQTDTNWHTVVAWGKVAGIIEKFVNKGKEVGIVGKLTSRSYETHDGNQRNITEIVANEILLLNGRPSK